MKPGRLLIGAVFLFLVCSSVYAACDDYCCGYTVSNVEVSIENPKTLTPGEDFLAKCSGSQCAVNTASFTICDHGCNPSTGRCYDDPEAPSSPTAGSGTGTDPGTGCPTYCCTGSGLQSLAGPHSAGGGIPLSSTCAGDSQCGVFYSENLKITQCEFGCDTSTGKCKTEEGEEDVGGKAVEQINEMGDAIKRAACTLFCIVVSLAGAIAVLAIMAAGLRYTTAEDSADRNRARKTVVYALLGLTVILLSCPIINFLFGGTVLGATPCACECFSGLFGGTDGGGSVDGESGGGESGGEGGGESGGGGTSGAGESCISTYSCVEGYYCGNDKKCHLKRATGIECDENDLIAVDRNTPGILCKSGLCSNGYCINCYENIHCTQLYGTGYECVGGACILKS